MPYFKMPTIWVNLLTGHIEKRTTYEETSDHVEDYIESELKDRTLLTAYRLSSVYYKHNTTRSQWADDRLNYRK